MTPDEQARQTFEKLLGNILAHVRTAPPAAQESVLAETLDALRSIAAAHGLSAAQASSWAHEIDRELRFRLLCDPEAISNDNS